MPDGSDIDALRTALTAAEAEVIDARAKATEAEARAANAVAMVSDAEAQIAALKLMIEKLRRALYVPAFGAQAAASRPAGVPTRRA